MRCNGLHYLDRFGNPDSVCCFYCFKTCEFSFKHCFRLRVVHEKKMTYISKTKWQSNCVNKVYYSLFTHVLSKIIGADFIHTLLRSPVQDFGRKRAVTAKIKWPKNWGSRVRIVYIWPFRAMFFPFQVPRILLTPSLLLTLTNIWPLSVLYPVPLLMHPPPPAPKGTNLLVPSSRFNNSSIAFALLRMTPAFLGEKRK